MKQSILVSQESEYTLGIFSGKNGSSIGKRSSPMNCLPIPNTYARYFPLLVFSTISKYRFGALALPLYIICKHMWMHTHTHTQSHTHPSVNPKSKCGL